MAKVKKFANGGISTLGTSILGIPFPGTDVPTSYPASPTSVGGVGVGGGGNAQDGLTQIDAGAGTVRGALSLAQNALGGGGGQFQDIARKKGGQVKKYTSSDGRLNLKSSGVSTAKKNKSQSKW